MMTANLVTQMSNLQQLCTLQKEFERTCNIVSGFDKIECAESFYSKLKKDINNLTLNIVKNIPKKPDAQNDLLINSDIFNMFKTFLCSTNDKLKSIVIRCLKPICYSMWKGSLSSEDILCLMNKCQLIPLLIQEISSNIPKQSLQTLITIDYMLTASDKFKQIFLKNNIMTHLQPLYTKSTSSYNILDYVAHILFIFCKSPELEVLNRHYCPQILNALQVMIHYEDNTIIQMALESYISLFETAEEEKYTMDISRGATLWPIQMLNIFLDDNSLQKQFAQKSKSDQVIFVKTLKKYQQNFIKSAYIPPEIKQRISMFCATTVNTISFNLLQRLVTLLDNEYNSDIKWWSGSCIVHLLKHNNREVLQDFIRYGLFEKVRVILTSKNDEDVIDNALVSIFYIIELNLNAVIDAHLMNPLKKLTSCSDYGIRINTMKILLIAIHAAVVNDNNGLDYGIIYLYDEGVIGSFFNCLVGVIQQKSLDNNVWRNVMNATQSILDVAQQWVDFNGNEMKRKVYAQLKCCDVSHIQQDNTQHFENLIIMFQ